jgi:hypothetical protein
MATAQEKTDKELLGAFLRQRGMDESITAGPEEYQEFGRGVARNVPLLAGLPRDLGQILLKIDPRTRDLMKDQPWFSEDLVGGGEYFAEKMGLEREGGGLETLGELSGAFLNPELLVKSGVLGMTGKGLPFIERQIEKAIKQGLLPKTAKSVGGAERKTFREVLQEAENQKKLAQTLKAETGTPWGIAPTKIKKIEDAADDYIKESREKLYGGLDELSKKGVLYNMEKTTDALAAEGFIPLKGFKSGTNNPQVLEEGKVYFFNDAHARGDLKNIQGFATNPDLGMDIIVGGKDGMADAYLQITMDSLELEGAKIANNPFYVGQLRSNTPVGGQRAIKKLGPILDKLNIEIHMNPGFMSNWKRERQSVLTKHYAELDKNMRGTPYSDKFAKQVADNKKRLERKPDTFNPKLHKDMTEKLTSWYERVGNFALDESTGTYVRKADYNRYLERQAKQIPKKGIGGLIDKTPLLR